MLLRLRGAITEFVILDEKPFKVVEGKCFKRLMIVVLPNYELPFSYYWL